MLIKNPEILVDSADPFANDVLGRKESAEILTQFLQTIREPFVLAIDSSWGTGKTTFIGMWKEYLKKEGFPSLYFNAWENDFAEDPLISFIGEMQEYLDTPGLDPRKITAAKRHYDKIKKIGATLAKRAVPVALKIGTQGFVDLEEFAKEGIAEFAAKIAAERIEKYDKDKNSIKIFRENLEKYIDALAEGQKNESKPLVFFIDELDRCRPTYAIELLERLKHLFNIKGIIFVLALDKEQIAHSIRALYGEGMDAEGYLRRFIDLEYNLPSASHESYCKYLYNVLGFDDYLSGRTNAEDEKHHLLETFIWLARIFDLSLRAIEQCFSQFSIALRTTPPNIKLYEFLMAVLIALKANNPALYRQYVNRECSAEEILEYIRGHRKGKEFLNEIYGRVIEAHLLAALSNEKQLQVALNNYKQKAEAVNTSLKAKERAEFIALEIDQLGYSRSYNFLDELVKRIEISERFE